MTRWPWLPPTLTFLFLTGGVEFILTLTQTPEYLFPKPSSVCGALFEFRVELGQSLLQTGSAALAGLLLSALIGALSAILMSAHPVLRQALYPYAVFFQTVPIVAIAPMLIIWFGYGQRSIIAASMIVSIFPIVANTLTGLLSQGPELLDLFTIYKASKLDVLLKLRIPGAVPNFLTGLRIASGLSVIGALVGEFVADNYEAGGGIGTLVEIAIKEQRTDKVFAAVLVASILGLFFFGAVGLLGRFSMRRWQLPELRD